MKCLTRLLQRRSSGAIKANLFKVGFTHPCFVEFIHHGCQENFAQFGTTFHNLQKRKEGNDFKKRPENMCILISSFGLALSQQVNWKQQVTQYSD